MGPVAPEETPVDRRSFLAGCASLTLADLARAGDKEKPSSPDIERLIKQLGSRKFREREAASKALEKVGEAALPALRNAAKDDPDAEVRRRADLLMQAIHARLQPRWVAALKGHTAWVQCLAFSPDGKTLASGDENGDVLLWDVASRRRRALVRAPNQTVSSVAFTPDGKTLAVAGEARHWSQGDDDGPGIVRLWDVNAAKVRGRLSAETDVNSVAISPTGAGLAVGCGDGVRLWDIRRGLWRPVFRPHSDQVLAVAFSPDGSLLATGSGDETIRLWRPTTGKVVAVLKQREPAGKRPPRGKGRRNEGVYGVAFSPDGRLLAAGCGDDGAVLWDVPAGRMHLRLKSHTTAAFGVAFSPNGKLLALAGYEDRGLAPGGRVLVENASLWCMASMQERAVLQGHDSLVTCVVFSPDGKTLATASWDHTLQLWRLPP
jgi:WD40 repeat protein